MPGALRARIALLVLMGVLLIPLWASSAALRGLTHVLTCRDQVRASLGAELGGGKEPVLGSATQLERGEDPLLCDALEVEFASRGGTGQGFRLAIEVTNRSGSPWKGTMALRFDEMTIPLGIGQVDPGATRTETVDLRLAPGHHDIQGSLLIGP